MPLTQHVKQTIDQDANDRRNPSGTASRAPARKAPGTRLGIIQNWRGSTVGKAATRFGNALRDGR